MPASSKRRDVRVRELKIMELANVDTPQDVIAEMLGISQSTVSKTIKRVMERYVAIEVEEFRAKHLVRLDSLARTYYPKGKSGDIRASGEYREITKQMLKYVPGAEAPKQHDLNVSTEEKTLAALAIIEEIKAAGLSPVVNDEEESEELDDEA